MALNFPDSPVVGDLFSAGTLSWQWTGSAWKSVNSSYPPGYDIIPLDNLTPWFNGMDSRFSPTYQGSTVSITNPLTLILSINGINQSVNFPDYVWQSVIPQDGFMIDSDGYISFYEPVPIGSTFDGRLITGPTSTNKTTIYPFKATDIMLGA